MKRFVSCCLMLLMLMTAVPAVSEVPFDDAPFEGYYEMTQFLRAEPKAGANIKSIPPNTLLTLTPVNEKYARATYDGTDGYVYYLNAKRLPAVREMDKVIWAETNKFVFDAPFPGAQQVGTIPAETPIHVTAQQGGYDRIQWQDGTYYIRHADTKELPRDTQIVPREIYAREETPVRSLPLANAPQVYTLMPRQVYRATARARGYLKVSWGAQEGYVLSRDVTAFEKDTALLRVMLIEEGAALYDQPDPLFPSAKAAEQQLYFADGDNNGFYHIEELDAYVPHGSARVWALTRMTVCQLYAREDAPVYLTPEDEKQIATLSAGELYAASYQVGDHDLLRIGDTWGFVRSADVPRLLKGEMMNRTAALTAQDTVIFGDDGARREVPAGEKVMLLQDADAFYGVENGFIFKQDVTLIASDAPVDEYSLPAPKEIPLYDFPKAEVWTQVGTIPMGENVTVQAFCGCYLLVSCGEMTGYAKQEGLLDEETRGIPESEDAPKYALALDKSTRTLYAFELDENGQRTDKIVMSGKVAVGKRTTPTPSGTFTLGKKERWHRFTRSYTPHTTVYTRGKFIHGLPCAGKNAASVIDYMAHQAGHAVTGGCLRSPFELARWVYMNCPSYQTEMVIVNGGLFPADEEQPDEQPEEQTDGDLPDEGDPDGDWADEGLVVG